VRVYVQPVGLLKGHFEATVVELESNSTIQDLIHAFDLPKELRAIGLVDRKRQMEDYNLKDGDVVTLVCLTLGG
jgi:sulfur carrier protein ThiS